MDNPLSKLALDYWYQVLMVVGVVVFLASGSGLLKEFPVLPTATISLGSFFIGLGEWINHPLQTVLVGANIERPSGMLTGHPRSSRPIGVVFNIFGLALIVFGGYKLFA